MKKILAFCLAAVLLLALCACGENETAPTTAPTTAPSTAPTTVPTTAPTTVPTTLPTSMTEGEAKQIAIELMARYNHFAAVRVCCDSEYAEGDMTAYLTDAQKDIYIGSQHKITCCKSAAEVNAHTRRTLAESVFDEDVTDLLFSDDDGNMYVIIYPTEYYTYHNHRVISFDDNTIVVEADDIAEGEFDGTVKMVCTRTAGGFVVADYDYTPVQRDVTEDYAKQIATSFLEDFVWYNAVGTCCELDYCAGDMSEFLSDAQKAEYMGSQQRIKCCRTPEQVKEHIDRTFAKPLISGYPDKLLFNDDKGKQYIIVYPSGLEMFGDVRIISYDNNKIVAEADGLDYDETVLYTVRFTCEKANPWWMLTQYE